MRFCTPWLLSSDPTRRWIELTNVLAAKIPPFPFSTSSFGSYTTPATHISGSLRTQSWCKTLTLTLSPSLSFCIAEATVFEDEGSSVIASISRGLQGCKPCNYDGKWYACSKWKYWGGWWWQCCNRKWYKHSSKSGSCSK